MSSVTIHLSERTTCTGDLLAVDAGQALLHVQALVTPMGTYPRATVRTSDVLCIQFNTRWNISPVLPAMPPSLVERRRPSTNLISETKRGQNTDQTAVAGRGVIAAPRVDAWDPRSDETRKYWLQRYMLFSKFDDGIQLDREGWFSVTPEVVAEHIAQRCRCDLVIDAFAGVGGNAIQFAFTCERVIAVDIDADRLAISRHNAVVYDVEERIQFLHADFLELAPRLKADVVFLSPPWGGPEYMQAETFDLDTMMGGLNGAEILAAALIIAPSVAYFLPKNIDQKRCRALARQAGVSIEFEHCVLNKHDKGIVAYFGFDER